MEENDLSSALPRLLDRVEQQGLLIMQIGNCQDGSRRGPESQVL
jgi:hypothetical protein